MMELNTTEIGGGTALATASHSLLLENLYRSLAEHNTVTCLLNCYLREYAIPAGEANLNANVADCPLALRRAGRHQLVLIEFPSSQARLLVQADCVSLLGRCRFASNPFLKTRGRPWQVVNAQQLSQFLLQYLADCLETDFNGELLNQISNSAQITQAFLMRRRADNRGGDHFLRAEQDLLWGHAMHPAPKSRQGVTMDDLMACSPEVFASFELYWFEVAPELVEIMGESEDWNPEEIFSQLHSQSANLYPCHPWEAYTILRQPVVREAIARGLIKPLGSMGDQLSPTSSVRTLYHPNLPAQLKFSINVRLTNCVRKNAWYELESAVVLTRLLRSIQDKAEPYCARFEVMPEPVATTLNLDRLADATGLAGAKSCRESFGILYRASITAKARAQYCPTLAASVFAWDADGDSALVKRIEQLCRERSEDYAVAAVRWFRQYLYCLLPGVFHYFFRAGVAFEPHLQNVLIGFSDNLPARIWIRDLEGTKLLPEFWPNEKLAELSPRARDSVYYSREQGWQRIAYCALINNISEGIFHCAASDRALEKRLWRQVAKVVEQWQNLHGREPELQGLLAGEPIPCKNNFTTRLMKQADRHSGYTLLSNPMVMA